jgi:CRP/FNR family cyclic AMP-dependent transcriptional regulator
MSLSTKIGFDAKTFKAKFGSVIQSRLMENQVIYEQGNTAGSLYYIQKGKVKLTVVSEHGKERVVGVLEVGDFCGEGCLSGQLLRSSTATTMCESTIIRLEKTAVDRALHEDLMFSEFFVSYLLDRNARLTADLVDHLFNSSERRLARVLLLLAKYERQEEPSVLLERINQQTLAKMIGTTRSRVNYFMNKFRRLGFIEYNGQIKIHNSLLNVVLYDPAQHETPLTQFGTVDG